MNPQKLITLFVNLSLNLWWYPSTESKEKDKSDQLSGAIENVSSVATTVLLKRFSKICSSPNTMYPSSLLPCAGLGIYARWRTKSVWFAPKVVRNSKRITIVSIVGSTGKISDPESLLLYVGFDTPGWLTP